MFLQKHNFSPILVTQVNMHRMVDNLTMSETQPVQVVQKVAHGIPEFLIVIVTIAVLDHILEH